MRARPLGLLTILVLAPLAAVGSATAKPNCPPDSDAPACGGGADFVELTLGGGTVDQGLSIPLTLREVKSAHAPFRKIGGLKITTTAPGAKVTIPGSINDAPVKATFTAGVSTPPGIYAVTVESTGGTYQATSHVKITHPIPLAVGAPKNSDGTWPTGHDSTELDASACTTSTYHVNVMTASNVSGALKMSVDGLPPGLSAHFEPSTVTAKAGGGITPVHLVLQAAPNVSIGTKTVTIIAEAAQATGREQVTLAVKPGHIDAVNPDAVSTPQAMLQGSRVTILGAGFCSDATVQFGNAKAVVKASVDPSGTSLTAEVPRLATGKTDDAAIKLGVVTVVSAGKALTSAPIAVDNWRDVDGFAFGNTGAFQSLVGGYSIGDLAEVFGSGEIALEIMFDPISWILIPLAERIYASGGQCFGFTLAALNFARNAGLFQSYPAWDGVSFDKHAPGKPRDAWHLLSPLTAACQNSYSSACADRSPGLSHYIHLQHLHQFSSQMADFLASNDGFAHSSDFKALARHALLDPSGAMVILRDGTRGHVVPLVDVRDGANGGVILETGDPNVPFSTAEDDAAGDGHATAVARTEVRVEKDGSWTFQNNPSKKAMSSNAFDLFVTPASTFANVDFPTALTAATALAHLIFGADGAEVRQITDAAGRTMFTPDGKVNRDARSSIPKSAVWPVFGGLADAASTPQLFVLPAASAYRYQVQGAGPYTLRAANSVYGGVAELGGGGGGGSGAPGVDEVIFDPKGALEVRTSAPRRSFKGTLAVRKPQDKSQRKVAIEGIATKQGPLRVELAADLEHVIYRHVGDAGEIRLELTSTLKPGVRLAVPPVKVAHGDVVTFKPNWAALDAAKGNVEVRSAAGRVTNLPMR